MSKNTWKYEIPDVVFETQRVLKNMTSTFETWNDISKSFSYTQNLSGAFAAVESFQSVFRNVCLNSTFETLSKNATAIQSFLDNTQIPNVIDIVPTMERILPIIDSTWKAPSIDWDCMSKTLATYDYDQDQVDNMLTEEYREELNESVKEILVSDDSENLVKSKFLEFQNRHPVLAFVLIQILLALLINIVSGIIGDWLSGVMMKKANLYEEPAASSKIVVCIDVNQSITIVNDVPYYYEVVYTEPETGEEKKGYIYKPNISIQQKDAYSDAQSVKYDSK